MSEKRRLIRPSIVPIRVLTKLAAVGVENTDDIHHHIRHGTLQELYGIGPKWEERIIRYYSEAIP